MSYSEWKEKFVDGVDIGGKSGIIRENSGKEKPITPITDGAINKVPLVNIPGYDKKQCQYIQEQHKELLRYARDNNDSKEVAFVFKSDMTRLEPFMGSDDRLDFGTELLRNGRGLTVLHNHPRNSSFSTVDIDLFINNDSIKSMTIVKNNGKVEFMTKTEKYSKQRFCMERDRLVRGLKAKGQTTNSAGAKLIAKLLGKNKSGVAWNVY